MRDEKEFSDESATDDDWKSHFLLEEPIGSTHTAKVHVFSNSFFGTGSGASDPASVSKYLKANFVLTMNSCKNRNDIAGQSNDVEWTCVLVTRLCK